MKKYMFLCFVLATMVLLTACGDSKYQEEYIKNAKEILQSSYNIIDANVTMNYLEDNDEYKVYNLCIDSDEIESLHDEDKLNLVKDIDDIYVDGSEFLVIPKISSNGNEYRVDVLDANILQKNGEDVYNYALENKDSMEFKVFVYRWIEDRYDYYDEKYGYDEYDSDKYSDEVFKDAGKKFDVTQEFLDNEVWIPEIANEAWKDD